MMKFIRLIIYCFCLMAITGCWNSRELKSLGIIDGAAIEKEKDELLFTCEIIKPTAKSKSELKGSETVIMQSKGENIFEASRNASSLVDRKLYWTHANVYLFSEDIGKEGLLDYLDFFIRDHETRAFVNIAIMKDCKGEEIIGKGQSLDKYSSKSLKTKLDTSAKINSKAYEATGLSFLQDCYSKGIEAVVGVASIGSKKINSQTEVDKNNDVNINIEGAAVFRGDKMVGFLNGEETRGLNFVRGNVKGTIIAVNLEDNKYFSLEVVKANSDKEVVFKGDKVFGQIEIKIRGKVAEVISEQDIEKIQSINRIENKLEAKIEKDIKDTIKKVQSYKSDVFGLGQELYRHDYNNWKKVEKNWNESFAKLEIKVEVKVDIDNYGITTPQLVNND